MKKLNMIAAGLIVATSAAAAEVEMIALDQACEEALALSALPATMRERANVYVWQEDAYVKTISSDLLPGWPWSA